MKISYEKFLSVSKYNFYIREINQGNTKITFIINKLVVMILFIQIPIMLKDFFKTRFLFKL